MAHFAHLARCDRKLGAWMKRIGPIGRDSGWRASFDPVDALARALLSMDDDVLIAALVPVRGIGRWIGEMMLMFRLGRPDVRPIDDFGVRKGAQLIDKAEAMLRPKELLERGERWGPYRTCASLYLWRVADFGVESTLPGSRSQHATPDRQAKAR